MSTALVLSMSYPFGSFTERAFLEPDLLALRKRFDRVVVIPFMAEGEAGPLPDGIEMSLCVARSKTCQNNFLKLRRIFDVPLRWLADSPGYALTSAAIASELAGFVAANNLTARDTAAYSFWFERPATALAMLHKKTGIPFVLRAHGYDLLIDKASKTRLDTLLASSGVHAVSRAGAALLQKKFPEGAEKISTSYLGISLPSGAPDTSSAANTINFLSCSRVVPLKRVHLNIRFVAALAAARPDMTFSLTHIGGTAQQVERLHALLQELYPGGEPTNFHLELTGDMPNADVLEKMSSGMFDCYLLLSTTEGLPVAMMEAMSRGIMPVVTDVGGCSEAVSDDCGILLSPGCDEREFVSRLTPVLDDSKRLELMKRAAFRKMADRFDGSRLRARWADNLFELLHD